MHGHRLAAQLLAGPRARSPVAVAERLLAVQAQDARGARLAIRARSDGLTAADVDTALTCERALVISWLNRGTLHLVRSEDLPWLHAVTTPPRLAPNARRLAQEGVSPGAAERGVGIVERALADEGPQTREQLADRLRSAGVPTAGQALVHVLMLACLRGIAVRGPVVEGRHAYALVRDWLGEPARAPVDRDRALAELARRYLAGHGPAGDRDLARWAGINLGEARAGLTAIASHLDELGGGLVALAGRTAAPPPAAPPRLLGMWDALLMGWRSREPVLGGRSDLVTVNGIFKAFALLGGRAAGTWSLQDGRVALEPFGPLDPAAAAALEADAADVERFLSPVRGSRPASRSA